MSSKNEFDKTEYWVETAEYDLETSKVMLKGKRYLYVGFVCNLAIEKILKAYYVHAKKQMLYDALDDTSCKEIIKKTEDFLIWTKKELRS